MAQGVWDRVEEIGAPPPSERAWVPLSHNRNRLDSKADFVTCGCVEWLEGLTLGEGEGGKVLTGPLQQPPSPRAQLLPLSLPGNPLLTRANLAPRPFPSCQPAQIVAQVPACRHRVLLQVGIFATQLPPFLPLQEPPCNLEDDEVFLGSEARPSSTQADPFRHCSVEELYELLETLGR